MNLVENGTVIEKVDGMMLSRQATTLEIFGDIYLRQMLAEPDEPVEHIDEIILISHYARKGEYTKAEQVIQKLIGEVKE